MPACGGHLASLSSACGGLATERRDLIWLETPIIDHFRKHIVLYKRYIDDILLIWSGSPVQLCLFRAMFGTANINIKLECKERR